MTHSVEVFSDGTLKIDKQTSDDEVILNLSGKSIIRDSMDTLLPIFKASLEEAVSADKRLVLDFRPVSYMNSSSFAPVIKVLEKARTGKAHLAVLYNGNEKWQETSFSAMTIFKTVDGRISIDGESDDVRH
ncbi:hypothetical protein [Saccharospirillum sp.]|uniref:hypothetical protein n=1 Tax=Saccharospirillum sp. TaxID=2033801 RepID=UPI0034A00BA1